MAASNPRTPRHCRPIERRPPMLKDFLSGDDAGVRHEQPLGLQRSRSRSRAAADATISAFQKLLSAVKSSLPLPAVKSPSKKKKVNTVTAVVQVRVKDILRWQSFRDGPRSDGADEATCGGGGGDLVRTGAPYTFVGPTKEGVGAMEEEEQKSPVSVLEWSSIGDDEEPVSAFDQTLANVERTRERLLESIKRFEGLACVDETDAGSEEEEVDDRREGSMPNVAQLGVREEIEECMRDIEREAQWGEFMDQKRQLGFEMEIVTLNALLDELLFELVN